MEGYAWSENTGWIRLGTATSGGTHTYGNTTAADYGVNRDGVGNLSGYAWSSTVGWINFNPTHGGVTIDQATGVFSGYAWSENVGWIHFQNASPAYKVSYSVVPILTPIPIPTVTTGNSGLPPLPPTMNLKVGFLGNGTGSLKLQTGKNFPGTDNTLGNCKKDDECYFPNLETASWVKITPQADAGSEFKGWGGSSSCNDGNPFMISNLSCTAYFSLLPIVQPPVIIVPPVVTLPTTDSVLPPIPPVLVNPAVVPTTDVPPVINLHLTDATSPVTPDPVSLPNQVVTPVEVPTLPTVEDSSTAGETEAISTSATESLVEPTEAETLPPVDTSPCLTDRHYRIHLDEGCDAEGQTVENLTIVRGGSLADANIIGIITNNQGLVSNLILEATAILEGGYVTDQIINNGLMKNFIFVGAQISGGMLAGKIVIASQVDNEIRDVVLAAGTVIQGKIGEEFVAAKLAGKITGDATDPALLENVTIAGNTELENVILGEGVVLGQNVKQKNVVMVCTNQRSNGKGFDQGGFPFDDDQTCFTVQENAIALTLDPASSWLEQSAEQLFVVIQGQKAFMFTDQWQEWDGELATLQPAQSLTVSTVQTLEFPDMSNFEGEFKFYVGLRLKSDGTIVYHQVR